MKYAILLSLPLLVRCSSTSEAKMSAVVAASPFDALVETAAQGLTPATPIYGARLEASEHAAYVLEAEAGRCYTVLATGSEDVDVAVYDPRNTRVGNGDGRASACATSAGRYRVEASVRGGGELTLRAFAGEKTAMQPKRTVEAIDPLTQQLRDIARAAAPGAKQVGPTFRGTAKMSDYTHFLTAGRCYTFVAVGTGMDRLSLFLWDPNGKRRAENKPRGTQPVMYHCATMSGPHHFQAKTEGRGSYGVGVFEK